MKTAHQFARELLAGPDLPVFHFDPSCAGLAPDDDTSISDPVADVNPPETYEEDGESKVSEAFITISGNQREENDLGEDA